MTLRMYRIKAKLEDARLPEIIEASFEFPSTDRLTAVCAAREILAGDYDGATIVSITAKSLGVWVDTRSGKK